MTPTARSLAFIAEKRPDWLVGMVERRVPAFRRRDGAAPSTDRRGRGAFTITKDLFGFADAVAIVPGVRGVLALQFTSQPLIRPHVLKVTEPWIQVEEKDVGDVTRRSEPNPIRANLLRWLEAGNGFEIWGWSKRGGRGERKLWRVVRHHVLLDPAREIAVQACEPER